MKIILEIPELEEIVKENISSKYPNQDAKVTVQNKRNGIEVTVVLTDKPSTKCCESKSAEPEVTTDSCVDVTEAEEETLA